MSGRYRKCVSCRNEIRKTAHTNPYLCRECEHELKSMDIPVPINYGI